MIIFLYGSDKYRLREYRLSLMKEYRKKHSTGVNVFYFNFSDNTDPDRLEEFLKTSSFFNEHRLGIITGSFTKKNVAEKILNLNNEYKFGNIKDITLFFSEPGTKKDLETKDKKLFQLLNESNNVVKTFDPLTGIKLTNWLKNEFSFRNCLIEDMALKLLIETVGNDSWDLINEIDKLSARKNGGEIYKDDISDLVYRNESLNIFDLIDAIASKNKLRALELLYKEIQTGRDPYYILTMLTYQFRNITTLKNAPNPNNASLLKSLGIHPFVAQKSNRQGGRFTPDELKNIYKDLLRLDINFKKGNSRPPDLLYSFVLNL